MKTVLSVLVAFAAVSVSRAQPKDGPKSKDKPPEAKGTVVVLKDRSGQFRFQVRDADERVVMQGVRGYDTEEQAIKAFDEAAAIVRAARPKAAAPPALEAKGYVIPSRQVTVYPVEVGGKLVALDAVEGKQYGKGDVLAKIDPTASEAAVTEAKVTLVGAEKRLSASKAADAVALQADVAVAKARLTQAQRRLDNCVVRAPISGTVLTKRAELGNLVSPMVFAGGGAICEMADLSDLEVEVKVSERDIAKLKVGQKCRIIPTAYPDREYVGTIDRMLPIADRADNSISLRVKVALPPGEEKTPGKFLKPEMGATVKFLVNQPK